MRVLHLAGEYPPRRIGGISTFLENLATSQAREAEVGVLVVRAEQYANDPARNGEDHRVRVGTIDIDFDALSGPVLTGAALQALVPQHPMLSETWDVLHMHDWYGTLPALVGSTRGAPAVMMSAHLPLRFGFTYANHAVPLRARVRLEALGTRLAARVVAVSRHVADLLAREYDVPESALRVVHNGVDLEAFTPGGARDEAPMVLAVNRLSEQKGLSHLLEAFEHVRAELPDARLELAGDGPGRGAFEAEVESRGLGEVVEVHGYVRHSQLLALYRRASVFVSASIYEPFGLTTIEAMASGTPVVASSLGGASEFVRDGIDGYVRPPHEGLGDAILAVIPDVERMGAAARVRAEEFGWDRVKEAMARCYDGALESRA